MKPGKHHLHCVGGGQIVPDARGTYLRSPGELAARAQQRLRGLIAAMPTGLDWAGWMVDVHDAGGRHVIYVEFDPAAESKGGIELPE